jgi:hypothetical protein
MTQMPKPDAEEIEEMYDKVLEALQKGSAGARLAPSKLPLKPT